MSGMDTEEISSRLEAAVEKLAALEHERWAHWQRYVPSVGEWQSDGSLVIAPDLVARWERQIATPYANLTEAERESDREQVRRYLPVLKAALAR